MEKEELKELINRYLAGQPTRQDSSLLETWYLHLHEDQPMEVSPADRLHDMKKVKKALDQKFNKPFLVITTPQSRLALAASLVCAIGIGLYYINYTRHTGQLKAQHSANHQKQIVPGSNQAILTLSDGRKINLSDTKKGRLAMQAGTQITKTTAGELAYTVTDHHPYPVKYNKIETPKGGFYKVHLPDGSRVWLNAASTLTYPAAFTSLKERRVKLSGEAYFEVARNRALPFRVITGRQSVEVLGTHFNITSYQKGAEMIRTTLLEGKIMLNQKTILKPGEQAVNYNSMIRIAKVDTDQVVAWKNGYFIFNKGDDFRTAMHEVERWYNVEFVYPGPKLPEIEPRGMIPRSSNLTIVLNGIQLMGKVHLKIEGRRIIVTN